MDQIYLNKLKKKTMILISMTINQLILNAQKKKVLETVPNKVKMIKKINLINSKKVNKMLKNKSMN
jgi:hypothetical protein